MQELANRLIAQARGTRQAVTTPDPRSNSLAVGTLVERARFRVGLWPLKSDANPEAAMGIMTALGFLLERWREIIVYRLFTELDGDPDDFDWDINLSQFGVDDFEVDGLDENVAIWGTLERETGIWVLTIEIENDLAGEADENPVITLETVDLRALLAHLPKIAADIASLLGTEAIDTTSPLYTDADLDETTVSALLADAFAWENELLMALWGASWPEEAIREDLTSLLEKSADAGGDFAPWLISHAVARGLRTEAARPALLPAVQSVIDAFPNTAIPALIVAPAVFDAGPTFEDTASNLVQAAIAAHPDDITAREMLVELFVRSDRLMDMVDVFQSSIENEVVSVPLYLRYGELLTGLRLNGMVVPRYVLAEGDRRDISRMLDEAVAAYQAVLALEPDNTEALYRRALLLAEGDDEDLWETFRHLVRLDTTGERTRAVIDSFQFVEDVTPGIAILEQAVERLPNQYAMRVNLAAAFLADERGDEARDQLEQAEEMTDNLTALTDIERLMLSANDGDFELHLGAITDVINSRRPLSVDDIEYLEDALEEAPSFSQGYLLLARGYLIADDSAAALETLLDGQKYLPEDAEITTLLAQTLWTADERDLAFEFLNQGLEHNADSVSLLALTGQFLYEDGQTEQAKDFLTRAESLEPANTILRDAKLHIARNLDD